MPISGSWSTFSKDLKELTTNFKGLEGGKEGGIELRAPHRDEVVELTTRDTIGLLRCYKRRRYGTWLNPVTGLALREKIDV